MTYTASIFFMGEYRPAYFEADTAIKATDKALRALAAVKGYNWFYDRFLEASARLERSNCSAFACEHGCRGVSLAARPHDPFLDSVTRKLKPFPGLDYSEAVNA